MQTVLPIKSINKYISLLVIILYLFPVILNQGDTQMRIHDQLDSFNVFEVVISTGNVFQPGDVIIDNIMNGLPRSCYPSGYNIVIWMLMIFGSTTGFFLNYIVVHVLGFIGMLLFLNKHLVKSDPYGFNWLASAAFAILPVCTLAGASLSGIPFVFYAFFNLKSKKSILSSYLLLICYCLYSSLIHTGIFIILFFGIVFLYLLIAKKANLLFFYGLVIMVLCYAFIQSDLIESILFSKTYSSHRLEFHNELALNIKGVIGTGILMALNGDYSSANYFGILIFSLAFFTLIFSFIKRNFNKQILYLSIGIFFTGIFISFLEWNGLEPVYKKFKFLDSFNFKRIHFLLPVLVYSLFALSIHVLISLEKKLLFLIFPVIVIMLVYNFDLNKKYNKNPDDLTFNEFFSKELLQEVDRYIRLPKKSYRIINLGIQPSVTQCSGFYTLDSYQNNYPLEYKHAFRKIIQDELAKDKEAEKYFDEWGNRCYVPFNAKKDSAGLQTIDELSINTAAFKELGGQFIFSAAAIKNSEALHLKFHRVFKHPESKYTLYLYEAL